MHRENKKLIRQTRTENFDWIWKKIEIYQNFESGGRKKYGWYEPESIVSRIINKRRTECSSWAWLVGRNGWSLSSNSIMKSDHQDRILAGDRLWKNEKVSKIQRIYKRDLMEDQRYRTKDPNGPSKISPGEQCWRSRKTLDSEPQDEWLRCPNRNYFRDAPSRNWTSALVVLNGFDSLTVMSRLSSDLLSWSVNFPVTGEDDVRLLEVLSWGKATSAVAPPVVGRQTGETWD